MFLAACSSGPGEQGGGLSTLGRSEVCLEGTYSPSNEMALIGGKVVSRESWLSKTVVSIQKNENEHCTGVLVDRDIVLTAAHCMIQSSGTERGQVISVSNLKVLLSPQPDCDNIVQESHHRAVSKMIVHPSYLRPRADLRADLAMIQLANPAPEVFRPSRLAQHFVDPRDQPYLVAGYGRFQRSDSRRRLIRTLRAGELSGLSNQMYLEFVQISKNASLRLLERLGMQRTSTYRNIQEATTADYGASIFPRDARAELTLVDNSNDQSICDGDSGGAAYSLNADQKYVVSGIASATTPRQANERTLCNFVGVYTNVLYFRQWIEESHQNLKTHHSVRTTVFE